MRIKEARMVQIGDRVALRGKQEHCTVIGIQPENRKDKQTAKLILFLLRNEDGQDICRNHRGLIWPEKGEGREKWIAVEPGCKMPGVGEKVLVTLQIDPAWRRTVRLASYRWLNKEGKHGWAPDEGRYLGKRDISPWVLAWRPLPKPYTP